MSYSEPFRRLCLSSDPDVANIAYLEAEAPDVISRCRQGQYFLTPPPELASIALRVIHRGDPLIVYGCYETQQAVVFKEMPGTLPTISYSGKFGSSTGSNSMGVCLIVCLIVCVCMCVCATFAAGGGPVTAGTHLRVWPDDWCYADEYNEKLLDYWVNPRDDRDE